MSTNEEVESLPPPVKGECPDNCLGLARALRKIERLEKALGHLPVVIGTMVTDPGAGLSQLVAKLAGQFGDVAGKVDRLVTAIDQDRAEREARAARNRRLWVLIGAPAAALVLGTLGVMGVQWIGGLHH